MTSFNSLVTKYQYDKSDSPAIARKKSLILIVATFCSLCGLIWGFVFYANLGVGITTMLPFLFTVLVFPSIFLSHYFSNYRILVYAQLICITGVPCLIQWSLGSIHDSGFILTWCFLGPLGSILYLKEKHTMLFMIVFILIICISVIFVPIFSEDAARVTDGFRMSLYLMNTITPFLIIFIASRYYYNGMLTQRKKNNLLLKSLKEKNKRIQKSLKKEKELSELKSSFVSTASHQFRTPLASIQANSDLLEILSSDHEVNSELYKKKQKTINRIKREISRMTELMDDVLLIGKITSGNVRANPSELNLVDFCEKLAKEFNALQNDSRGVNIIIKGAPYDVYLDRKLLSHSLSNLFSNAFKYSIGKPNPELVISFKSKEFVLLIKDYGIGIPKNDFSKLFQPFFRANNVTDIKGTGLGLSIAKEYVETNNGQITAASIEGEGSCFEMKFKR